MYNGGVMEAFQPEKLLYREIEVKDSILKAKALNDILD
jgi:hypothetical protein